MRLPLVIPPYPLGPASLFARLMRGTNPSHFCRSRLFATHPKLWEQMLRISQFHLGPKSGLDLRTRELLADRACAPCNCEYEWESMTGRAESNTFGRRLCLLFLQI